MKLKSCIHLEELRSTVHPVLSLDLLLKGYCTVFQHALKLLELSGIDLT